MIATHPRRRTIHAILAVALLSIASGVAARAQSAAGAGEARIQLFDNFAVSGKTGEPKPDMSISTCTSACEQDKSCAAFSYNKWEKTCLLSTEAGVFHFDPGAISGLRSDNPPPATSEAAFSMDCTGNRGLVGATLRAETSSLGACTQSCANEKDCVAFGFDGASKQCVLYSSSDEMQPAASSIVGIKRQVDSGVRLAEAHSCEAFVHADAAVQRPPPPITDMSIVVTPQRCVVDAFKKKLLTATQPDPDLVSKAMAECDEVLAPFRRALIARTHDRAFADRTVASIRNASLRGLGIGLMSYYFAKNKQ